MKVEFGSPAGTTDIGVTLLSGNNAIVIYTGDAPLFSTSAPTAQSTQYPTTFFLICSGVVPNVQTLVAPWSTAVPSSVKLIDFATGTTAGVVASSTSGGNDTITFRTPGFRPAQLSGVATWFWFGYARQGGAPGEIVQQVIGTVGELGSGADLELQTTNIVAGSLYRLSDLKIKFPRVFEYV